MQKFKQQNKNNVIMKKGKFFYGMLATAFVLTTGWVMAQKNYNLQSNPNLSVSGTSTLHDWEMVSSRATGTATMMEKSGKLSAISEMKITMPAESIKSGKEGMDKKAYDALKTDKNKNISFTLKSATKNTDGTWTFTGNFTIAGTTKAASFKVTESKNGDAFQLKGNYAFKLTDYSVAPPKAMAGTIKTGDAVKINFNLKFK